MTPHAMPEAPAATSVLSITSTCPPCWARCQAVDSPWTPAPTTSVGMVAGREVAVIAYSATLVRNVHGDDTPAPGGVQGWCAWRATHGRAPGEWRSRLL